MILVLLAYLGGVLTILSPCVLPVIPFIFARADRPVLKSGLPLFVGMALTFAVVATLATIGGGWAVRANAAGRWIAIVLLTLFAVTLLFPWLADRLSRPFVALGGRLTEANAREDNIWQSGLLGVATGLLWAPCAGPILGLILTTAALQGASAGTVVLLLAYAAGSVTSLAVVLLAGKRAMAMFKRSQGAEAWIRRIVGVAVLAGVVVIAFGLDRSVLTKLSGPGTNRLESGLIAKLDPSRAKLRQAGFKVGETLPVLRQAPELAGATGWLNTGPLTMADLKGKVVLIDFWTYSCVNCLRSLPYVKAWAEQYGNQGLVVVGVHTPEFAFEREPENVRKAVADLGIKYPVAMDNDWAIWKAYENSYWPAHYFIDAQGRLRHVHLGEKGYAESEQVIRALLAERNGSAPTGPAIKVETTGAEVASQFPKVISPETYVGFGKALRFVSPGGLARDVEKTYARPGELGVGDWALSGTWRSGVEHATAVKAGGRIIYRFNGRDVNLVLGPPASGGSVRFRVTLDGAAPGADHGVDVNANGEGVVTGQRMYQLVRQKAGVATRMFEIEFVDPGVEAFAFTFG